MADHVDILCIGSVLWDVIGRADQDMRQGSDVGGRITQIPGGVAMNIAMTLTRLKMRVALLSALGMDDQGDALLKFSNGLGMRTDLVYRDHTMATDSYMAIEGRNGVIAAIADAHTLEAAGARILQPLQDGRLGDAQHPYSGYIALDGNLTETVLHYIATSPEFANADLRIAPASPGKALRLLPFIKNKRGMIYVNLEEAGLLCNSVFTDAHQATQALLAAGANRVMVSDGAQMACEGQQGRALVCQNPPQIKAQRFTGAGDTFMAAHIAAEHCGSNPQHALDQALITAARYVSGEDI